MDELKEYFYGCVECLVSFMDVNDCSNLWNEDEVIVMDIYIVCVIGEYSCVQQYLVDGVELVDFDKFNCGGWIFLMYVVYVGYDNIVNLFFDYYVNVNVIIVENGVNVFMFVVSCGNEFVVYFLLQNGVKIDV